MILPLLEIIEKECACDKYDFYFLKLKPVFQFDLSYDDNDEPTIPKLVFITREYFDKTILSENHETFQFIKDFVFKYNYKYFEEIESDDMKLFTYLQNNVGYCVEQRLSAIDLLDDGEFYKIFRNTWIGNFINNIANFKDLLNKKKQEYELDLDGLLMIN